MGVCEFSFFFFFWGGGGGFGMRGFGGQGFRVFSRLDFRDEGCSEIDMFMGIRALLRLSGLRWDVAWTCELGFRV